VENGMNHYICEDTRSAIRSALCERVSLRGIRRIFKVSLSWLLGFAVQFWEETPSNLGVDLSRLDHLGFEIDECWSFIGKKA